MDAGRSKQQSFWPEDQDDAVLARTVAGGNLASLVSVAGRRLLKAIDSPDECDYDAAVALLRDVLPNPTESYDPVPFIEMNTWTYAKSRPQSPHEYVMLRNSVDWREHLRFIRWLRKFGEARRWRDGRTYRYRIVGEFHYWAMWSPNDTIANRSREW